MGGGGGGGDVPVFCVSFSELLYFCVCFSQFIDAFFGSILPICVYFFLYIMRISSTVKQSFGAQNFRDVQLIPNF